MSQICLPLGIGKLDVEKLETVVQSSRTLQAQDPIFTQGQAFSKVYAVKSGTFKSSRVDQQGNEHVTAFHLPGELIGLDGIYPEAYSTTTVALDTAVLCSMDYDDLTELCTNIPALQRQLLRLLSRDVYESNKANAENADHSAAQKLAAFLSNLSSRYELRGYSGLSFNLAMSRQDIASHLGLSPETVSRLIKRFKQENLIEIENRHIEIIDAVGLQNIVACSGA
jgi:CRP/FNR family transcriptional regulator